MLLLTIKALYLVLPAYFANMMPVFFAKLHWLEFLSRPIDGGKKMGGRELFGRNKTWRGLIAGIIGGVAIASLQASVYFLPTFHALSLFNYHEHWLLFGFLAGLGALTGDLIKSFFKRRIGIKAGGAWPFFDQLDFVLGFFIFTIWLVNPGWQIFLIILVMTALLHPLSNVIGYLLGIKKVWW